MAFVGNWSVIFGETPSAAKWTQLGTDADDLNTRLEAVEGFNTIWWQQLGRTTLGSGGDSLSVTFTAKKYLHIIAHTIDTGGTNNQALTFNADTGNNYARRISINGAADASGAGVASIACQVATAASPATVILDVVNVAAVEKIVYGYTFARGTAGAAANPDRAELSGKWANTSAQVTTVTITNSGTGDYATGSEITVLGHN